MRRTAGCNKLLTQTNSVTVWELLRDGQDVQSLTQDVPAEFRQWIDAMEARFRGEYRAIEDAALGAMEGYPGFDGGERNIADKEAKKAFALYVMGKHAAVSGILFAMVDGKNYAPILWKMIRPRGDEGTFKVEEG